jgi:hypothetical protein
MVQHSGEGVEWDALLTHILLCQQLHTHTIIAHFIFTNHQSDAHIGGSSTSSASASTSGVSGVSMGGADLGRGTGELTQLSRDGGLE